MPSLAGTPIYERTFAPALDDAFRLIFVELRGNRTTAGDAATLTLGGLLDDMAALQRALGLERTAVLGHSGHSVLALAYAARFPERVSRVLVVGGMPGFPADLDDQIARYWEVAASPERKRRLAENHARLRPDELARLTPAARLAATYAADGPRYFYDPAYDCAPLWAGHDRYSPELHRRFWGPGGEFRAFDAAAALPRVAAPVFVAHGVFDFSVPPTVWAGVGDRLPRVTYRAFERSGHYPHLDEPAAFRGAVAEWLAST